MAALRPPKRVHLPSGLVVALDAKAGLAARERAAGAPLFSELVALVASGDLALRTDRGALDVLSLELRNFHALRAIATRLGWLKEETVELACRNCRETFEHAPCAALELGPFVDGELDDPELDRTLDLAVEHRVPPILVRGGVTARALKLRSVNAADAAPLHRALRRRRFVLSDRVVRAMGIDALGDVRDARRIADALARCSDAAWDAVGDLFLAAHYPLRLSSIARCPGCGARNDVDAPYERELEPSRPNEQSNAEVFPDFDAFDAAARAAYDCVVGPRQTEIRLVVDAEVPACDDGGEPLLGAYVPPGGDPTAPFGVGEITIYYRTFRAMWDEDGPYNWAAELGETVEHELEHHDGWRVGHDPMDDEERAEIARENVRLVGKKTAVRATVSAMGLDVAGFLAKTWPIWLIVAAATLATTVCGR